MRIYFFSPVPYSFLRQRAQHLADQFHSLGAAVTFVESTSIRGSLAKGFFPFLLEILKSFRWHLMALVWAWTGGLARQARSPRSQGKSTFEIVTPPVVLPLNRFDSRRLERVNGIVYRYFLWKAILGTRAAGEDTVAFVEQLSWAPAIHPGEFTRLYFDFLDLLLFSDITCYP